MKNKVRICSVIMCCIVLCASPAFAGGGGGLSGGALEATQWINKTILEGVREVGLDTAYNTAMAYAKQIQQYATQMQQYAEAIKGNLSAPFQVYNGLTNGFKNLYSTIRGTGEGLYSYANATQWMNDMKNATGWDIQNSAAAASNKQAYQNNIDIITKDESEQSSWARDIEARNNEAQGPTAAIQANTMATMAQTAAIRNQTALHVNYYQRQIDYLERQRNNEEKEMKAWKKENEDFEKRGGFGGI